MTEQEREAAIRYAEGADAAMKRAARRAREVARQTGTCMIYWRDGKIVREHPGPEVEDEVRE